MKITGARALKLVGDLWPGNRWSDEEGAQFIRDVSGLGLEWEACEKVIREQKRVSDFPNYAAIWKALKAVRYVPTPKQHDIRVGEKLTDDERAMLRNRLAELRAGRMATTTHPPGAKA